MSKSLLSIAPGCSLQINDLTTKQALLGQVVVAVEQHDGLAAHQLISLAPHQLLSSRQAFRQSGTFRVVGVVQYWLLVHLVLLLYIRTQ